jgi:glycosyltransferase involved in cell wall biosynthesis
LPETAGNAALFFDPENPEDMADRMVTLAEDKTARERLVKAGLKRAKNFSWDITVRKTFDIIMETAAK